VHTLNLGILAHVDAGKTSLTERLLYAAGAIDEVGRVDDGTTRTDSLALERRRGITIKAAVASFVVEGVQINLIDTPGHPDFIAEVERALNVLDGAVLVISAVEGVQVQTRLLMRTLRRRRIPTLLFVNKIDRTGADDDRVLDEIATRLTPAIAEMGTRCDLGTSHARFTVYGRADEAHTERLAELLGAHDDALIAAYLDDAVPYERLRGELAHQTARLLVHPVFFGSAITGAGVDSLIAGMIELLPAAARDVDGPAAGTIFKIERGPAAEKVAYVRMFSGSVRARDRLQVRGVDAGKVTSIKVFAAGEEVQAPSVDAGQIGKLWGLTTAQIGDHFGERWPVADGHHFAPPTLETVIVARHRADRGPLHVALGQLAEQDPLIAMRQEGGRDHVVSLYGEVQKEVLAETLANDYGIEVEFRETTTICIERPLGLGVAVEELGQPANPFLATAGFRVEPAPAGSGLRFGLDVALASIPLYVYKTVEDFRLAIEATVNDALREGLHGWPVSDASVTMTQSGYRSPETTAADFRKLAPLVVMSALEQAGTTVCEPIHQFHLEVPTDTLGAVVPALGRLGIVPDAIEGHGPSATLAGPIAAARLHELQTRLPGLTHGEGLLESSFAEYRPVRGPVPTRSRTDANPRNRKEYLRHVLGRM
jgi:ribosomal protection tetracycline resistance protein